MIYRSGNILDADAVPVIPVNTVGVMGAGLAKQAAQQYPLLLQGYQAFCRARYLSAGEVVCVHAPQRSFILFPTKRSWRRPSRLAWIKSGLLDLQRKIPAEGFAAVAFPKLGCGLGGLDWRQVRPLIEKTASKLEAAGIEVVIYGDQNDLD